MRFAFCGAGCALPCRLRFVLSVALCAAGCVLRCRLCFVVWVRVSLRKSVWLLDLGCAPPGYPRMGRAVRRGPDSPVPPSGERGVPSSVRTHYCGDPIRGPTNLFILLEKIYGRVKDNERMLRAGQGPQSLPQNGKDSSSHQTLLHRRRSKESLPR